MVLWTCKQKKEIDMFSPFVILFAFGLFVLNLTDEVKKEDRKGWLISCLKF